MKKQTNINIYNKLKFLIWYFPLLLPLYFLYLSQKFHIFSIILKFTLILISLINTGDSYFLYFNYNFLNDFDCSSNAVLIKLDYLENKPNFLLSDLAENSSNSSSLNNESSSDKISNTDQVSIASGSGSSQYTEHPLLHTCEDYEISYLKSIHLYKALYALENPTKYNITSALKTYITMIEDSQTSRDQLLDPASSQKDREFAWMHFQTARELIPSNRRVLRTILEDPNFPQNWSK